MFPLQEISKLLLHFQGKKKVFQEKGENEIRRKKKDFRNYSTHKKVKMRRRRRVMRGGNGEENYEKLGRRKRKEREMPN